MANRFLWVMNLLLASGLAFAWLGIKTIEPTAALAPAAAGWLPIVTATTVTLVGAFGWSMFVLRLIR